MTAADTTTRPLVIVEALLIRTTTAAAMIGVSPRTWRRLVSAGLVPEAIRFNKLKLYRVRDLVDWVDSGCPARGRTNKNARRAVTSAQAGGKWSPDHDSDHDLLHERRQATGRMGDAPSAGPAPAFR